MSYKDFYPKNTPPAALETTILMLRMIHKNPVFKECHSELPESFREDFRGHMQMAAVKRYERLTEASESGEIGLKGTIEFLKSLGKAIVDEIELDGKYFTSPFKK